MKKLQPSSVILFALIIPFIMGYRISPFTSQHWMFGIIFLGMLLYLVMDLFRIKESRYNVVKDTILWLLILIVIGGAFSSAIITRHKTHPIYTVHDIILQQEAAIHYLAQAKNPYAETYFGTFMEQWHYAEKEINPALYHFVMEPFYLVSAVPFYLISNRTLGYFDGRIPLLILFFVMLGTAFSVVKNRENRRLFITLLAFHPSMLAYTLEGRSDIYMFAFLFAGFALLYYKRFFLAGVPIALAFAIKQSAWPFFPLYAAYLYFKTKSFRKTVLVLLPFAITFLVFVIPFFLWNQKAFLESTIGYLNGSVVHSYPVSGYGLGGILVEQGLIKDKFTYYPFMIWQAVLCLPLLAGLIYWLMKKPSVRVLIMAYGILLFVYWYLSRYFNNSHLAYISVVFISSYFWPEENN